MKLNKKVIESIVVLCSLCVMTITAVTDGGIVHAQETVADEGTKVGDTGFKLKGVAGVAAVFADYQLMTAEKLDSIVDVEKTPVDVVTASAENVDAEEESAQETAGEPQLTEEEQAWQGYLMADIADSSLNVRTDASEEAEIVGKLYKGDRAQIVEPGAEWTKITSGNLSGYVNNAYCVQGTDALNYAKANCETVAKALTGGLRIRKDQNTDAEVVTTLAEGDQITVDTAAQVQDGWVAVVYQSTTCYVSAEFVQTEIQTGTGVTLEEEAAAKAKAEQEAAEKAAEEAAAKAKKEAKASQSSSAGIAQSTAITSSVDDVTLLAAIIQCEAGGESYDCQLAVGAVVVNRVKSGSFPGSVSGVIYQSGQFTPVSSGKLAKVLANGPSSTSINAASAALSGQDNTGGAHYFKTLSSGHSGTVIGAMIFY